LGGIGGGNHDLDVASRSNTLEREAIIFSIMREQLIACARLVHRDFEVLNNRDGNVGGDCEVPELLALQIGLVTDLSNILTVCAVVTLAEDKVGSHEGGNSDLSFAVFDVHRLIDHLFIGILILAGRAFGLRSDGLCSSFSGLGSGFCDLLFFTLTLALILAAFTRACGCGSSSSAIYGWLGFGVNFVLALLLVGGRLGVVFLFGRCLGSWCILRIFFLAITFASRLRRA